MINTTKRKEKFNHINCRFQHIGMTPEKGQTAHK
jgi:hypothetical protein